MKSMSRTRKAIGLKLPNGCPHRSSGVRLPSQIAKVSGPRSSASPIVPPALAEEFLVSTIALRSHQDKTYPGALVASLSIPWGDSGNERGGYHLVWAARSGRDRRRLAVARCRAGGTRYLAVSDRDTKAGHSLALKLVLAAPVSAATVGESLRLPPTSGRALRQPADFLAVSYLECFLRREVAFTVHRVDRIARPSEECRQKGR